MSFRTCASWRHRSVFQAKTKTSQKVETMVISRAIQSILMFSRSLSENADINGLVLGCDRDSLNWSDMRPITGSTFQKVAEIPSRADQLFVPEYPFCAPAALNLLRNPQKNRG
jgi:hypothetical protein